MGYNDKNCQFGPHAIAGSTTIDWLYTVGRTVGGLHDFGPGMTWQEAQDAISAASGSRTDWINAHPSAVQTYLNAHGNDELTTWQAECAAYCQPCP